jgi:hypothetical protein
MAAVARSRKLTPSRVLFALMASSILVPLFAAPASLAGDDRQRARCSEKMAQFIPALDKVLTEEQSSLVAVRAAVDEYLRFLPLAECNVEEVISSARRSKFFAKIDEWNTGYTIRFYSNSFIVSIPLAKDTQQMGFYGVRMIKTTNEVQAAREFETQRASKSATP